MYFIHAAAYVHSEAERIRFEKWSKPTMNSLQKCNFKVQIWHFREQLLHLEAKCYLLNCPIA